MHTHLHKLVKFLVEGFRALRTPGNLRALAFVFALTLAVGWATPASAQSFNITMTGLMESAASIFNGLWPAFAIIAGLSLGFVILKFVLSAIRGAFSGG